MAYSVDYLISLLGTATAAGVAATFAVLVMLIARRIRRRRDYRTTWADAWMALAVGYAARGVFVETVGDVVATSSGLRVFVLAAAAHAGTFLGASLFAYGTTLFARALPRRYTLEATAGGAIAYALGAAFVSTSLPALAVWEAPLLLALFGWAGATLLLLPDTRRSRRTIALAGAFAVAALLWASWFAVFGVTLLTGTPAAGFLAAVQRYHAYFEAGSLVLIGTAMLAVTMEQARRELTDATEALAVAHDQVRRTELYDLKTGCLNEKAFDEQVGLEVARGVHGAVMIAEVEDVAQVGRDHGSMAADELLWHCAQVLRGSIRPTDRLYRWHGDAFVLVLPGAIATEVRPRFQQIVDDAWPLRTKLTRGPIKLRATLGAASYHTVHDLRPAITEAAAQVNEYKPTHASGALRLVIND